MSQPLEVSILIERSVPTVWDHLTREEEWEHWWDTALVGVEPGWENDAELVWGNLDRSKITSFLPEKELQTTAMFMQTTWTVQPVGQATGVTIRFRPMGGAQFSDGGRAHRDKLASTLSRLKERVERETPSSQVRDADAARASTSGPFPPLLVTPDEPFAAASRESYGAVRRIDTGLKVFWIVSIMAGYLLGLLFAGAGALNIDEDLGPIVLLVGLALIVYALVIQCVVLHRIWKAIQGGPVRTTPGKAVGFLFIPFFNLYWVFQAFWGWAVDFNRSARERGLRLPRAPEGVALAISILAVVGVVPLVGLLAGLANLVLLGIFFTSAINRVNALAVQGPPKTGVPGTEGVLPPRPASAARPWLQGIFAALFYGLAVLSAASGAFWHFEGWQGSEDSIALFALGLALGLCGAALQLWFLRDRGREWPLNLGATFLVLVLLAGAASWIGRSTVVRNSRQFRASARENSQLRAGELAEMIREMNPGDPAHRKQLDAALGRVLRSCPKGSTRSQAAVVYLPVEGVRDRLWKCPPFKQVEVNRPFETAVVNALGNQPDALQPVNDADFIGDQANYFWLYVIRDADGRPLAVARFGAVRSSTYALSAFRN